MAINSIDSGLLQLIGRRNERKQGQLLQGASLLANVAGSIQDRNQRQGQYDTENTLARDKFNQKVSQDEQNLTMDQQKILGKEKDRIQLFDTTTTGRLSNYVESLPEEQRAQAYQDMLRTRQMLSLSNDNLPGEYDPRATGQAIALSRSIAEQNQREKAPGRDTRQVGDQTVTDQWNPRTRQYEEVGRGPKWNPNRSGTQLEVGADGTVSFSQGGAPISKKTQSTVEGKLFDANEAMSRISSISESFDPKYLEIGTQISAAASDLKERFGGELSEKDKEELSGLTEFKTNTLSNVNSEINRLTGAAVGVDEAKRLMGELPSLDDGKTVFKSKIQTISKRLKQAVIRYSYASRNGLNWKNIPLYKMDKIIDKRGSEIEKQLVSGGMPKAQAEAQAIQKVKQEFGL